MLFDWRSKIGWRYRAFAQKHGPHHRRVEVVRCGRGDDIDVIHEEHVGFPKGTPFHVKRQPTGLMLFWNEDSELLRNSNFTIVTRLPEFIIFCMSFGNVLVRLIFERFEAVQVCLLTMLDLTLRGTDPTKCLMLHRVALQMIFSPCDCAQGLPNKCLMLIQRCKCHQAFQNRCVINPHLLGS